MSGEIKKIATRESYGNALVELGAEYPNLVVLDADLAAATKTGVFKKAYPERHIDCGIAECNMVGVAAGLASTGMIPFVSSFAMFAAGKGFRTGEEFGGISAFEREDRSDPRGHFGRRGRGFPSVQ